jgi:hypothetical protein
MSLEPFSSRACGSIGLRCTCAPAMLGKYMPATTPSQLNTINVEQSSHAVAAQCDEGKSTNKMSFALEDGARSSTGKGLSACAKSRKDIARGSWALALKDRVSGSIQACFCTVLPCPSLRALSFPSNAQQKGHTQRDIFALPHERCTSFLHRMH